ncbi:tetratricopeptide repeat protein [Vibrio mimicus]
MRFLRWITIASLLLISSWVQATIYSSPMLNEANGLVEISPLQARKMAQQYLNDRHLAEKQEKHPATIARDEAESRTRTPGSTVDAMMILAQALYNLGETEQAQSVLNEAKTLSERYQLPYLLLDVQILSTRLAWQSDNDALAARERLRKIAEQYKVIENADQIAKGIDYKLTLLRAEIASKANDIELADKLFAQAKPYVDTLQNAKPAIEYHLKLGEHNLSHERYNLALSELLIAYWSAIESNSGVLLAEANTLLGKLFFNRQVLDKALDHFSQAADFYGRYEQSPFLPKVLKQMGDIYYQQGKYNLALVHYFNVIDHQNNNAPLSDEIEIRINLAATYLQLYNYPIAEQYLTSAETLLSVTNIPRLNGHAALLHSGLSYYQNINQEIVHYAEMALQIGESIQDDYLQEQAYRLLSLGYEKTGTPTKALEYFKKSQTLAQKRQNKLNQISEDAFRQQREFIEQTLHLVGQEKQLQETEIQHRQLRKIAFFLLVICLVFFMINLRRGYLVQRYQDEVKELHDTLFTHPRSRLNNLRMLNAKLPSSLENSNRNYEQWQLGELIQQPLNDRLRFALIDIPFMRNMYLQNGYTAGLELERAFGEFLKGKIKEPNRLYHFSDASLLYIEKNGEQRSDPETLFNQIQSWLNEFSAERKINKIVRMGIADYPFLPRAYTAINDKELLDILLMATHIARELSLKESQSHWVYLKAIDNAPAASFASENIRLSCKQAINQGLIKVHSSYKNEDNIKKLLKDG